MDENDLAFDWRKLLCNDWGGMQNNGKESREGRGKAEKPQNGSRVRSPHRFRGFHSPFIGFYRLSAGMRGRGMRITNEKFKMEGQIAGSLQPLRCEGWALVPQTGLAVFCAKNRSKKRVPFGFARFSGRGGLFGGKGVAACQK